TRTDGRFELIVDEAREFEVRVTSLDQKVVYGTQSVAVPDGETFTVELAFTGVTVSGTVVDKATQQPIGDANVWASRKDDDSLGPRGVTTGADGQFVMDLDPGEYTLVAGAPKHARASIELAVTETGLSGVQLELAQGHRLVGRVTDTRGQPAIGTSIGAVTE